jgi:hypothetical protein
MSRLKDKMIDLVGNHIEINIIHAYVARREREMLLFVAVAAIKTGKRVCTESSHERKSASDFEIACRALSNKLKKGIEKLAARSRLQNSGYLACIRIVRWVPQYPIEDRVTLEGAKECICESST